MPPVTSDFSDPSWGKATGEVCDMVQVPAYLAGRLPCYEPQQRPVSLFT